MYSQKARAKAWPLPTTAICWMSRVLWLFAGESVFPSQWKRAPAGPPSHTSDEPLPAMARIAVPASSATQVHAEPFQRATLWSGNVLTQTSLGLLP